MKGLSAIFIIVFCLLPNPSQGADLSGDENTQKKNKKVEKVLKVINQFGIGGSNVKDVAYFVDGRLDDGQFRIHESEFGGINMKLQFDTEKVKVEGFQMKFTTDDLPHWEINANPKEMMINYTYTW